MKKFDINHTYDAKPDKGIRKHWFFNAEEINEDGSVRFKLIDKGCTDFAIARIIIDGDVETARIKIRGIGMTLRADECHPKGRPFDRTKYN